MRRDSMLIRAGAWRSWRATKHDVMLRESGASSTPGKKHLSDDAPGVLDRPLFAGDDGSQLMRFYASVGDGPRATAGAGASSVATAAPLPPLIALLLCAAPLPERARALRGAPLLESTKSAMRGAISARKREPLNTP